MIDIGAQRQGRMEGQELKRHTHQQRAEERVDTRHFDHGVGKCGHCQINSTYVCQDGPVYHYPEIKSLQEAL